MTKRLRALLIMALILLGLTACSKGYSAEEANRIAQNVEGIWIADLGDSDLGRIQHAIRFQNISNGHGDIDFLVFIDEEVAYGASNNRGGTFSVVLNEIDEITVSYVYRIGQSGNTPLKENESQTIYYTYENGQITKLYTLDSNGEILADFKKY